MFRFFISRPREADSVLKKSKPEKIYGMDVGGVPCKELPDVVLFGGMRQSYCESLAVVIFQREGIRLKVPQDYEYPGFHGDEVRLTYSEFVHQISLMVGRIDRLPSGVVISMGALFEQIKQAALKTNNLEKPH